MKSLARFLAAFAALTVAATVSGQVNVQRLTDGTFNLTTAIGIAPGQVETVSGTITGSGPIGTTATISGGTISGAIVASSLTTSGNLTVSGSGTITGSAVFGAGATVSGALTASGSAVLASGLTVTGSSTTQTLSTSRFTDTGNGTISGAFTVSGSATAAAGFTVTGSSTVQTLSATTASVSSLTASGGILGIGATAAVGYGTGTGAGGAVVQGTNKATAVTLNLPTGQITMNVASLSSATNVSFTVTDSAVAAGDVPVLAISSGGTLGAYQPWVSYVGTGSFSVTVRNTNASTLSESPVISFVLLKGSSN